MDFDNPHTTVGRYVKNVLIALDQLGNTLWGGEADETVSSRLGRQKRASDAGGYRMRLIPRIGYWLLGTVDKDHCDEAIEHDENASHGQPAAKDPPRKGQK